ncbi:hypothetical protein V8F20_005507 [Naviculisporaceae sp. PSN 640]
MPFIQLLQIPLEATPSLDQQRWRDLVAKLASADGVVATHWAPQHENNKIGGIVATWKSLDAQKAWSESGAGQEFSADLKLLSTTNDDSTTFTEDIIDLREDPTPALTAHVVEVVWWDHELEQIGEAREAKAYEAFVTLQNGVGSQTEGGSVAGWGQKEFEHQGKPTRRFYCLIGWSSVEAHMACKKTEAFAESIVPLRNQGHVAVGMAHYPFRAI